MKRFFTFLFFGMSLLALPVQAQDAERDYVFIDKDGNVFDEGITVLCNEVELDGNGVEIINSGVSFMNRSGSNDDYFMAHYVIERIDNGAYQICFPSNCNTRDEVGSYETGRGMLSGTTQDLQSEWFPEADGECIVNVKIEVFTRQAGFPPTYSHKAWGPSITLRFVKGGAPDPIAPIITFVPGNPAGYNETANAPDEMEMGGIKVSTTVGAFKAAQYRFAKGSVTTFTSSVGKITKIEFTCMAKGTEKYGPGCFADNCRSNLCNLHDRTFDWQKSRRQTRHQSNPLRRLHPRRNWN